jgi:hypothetical protein
VATVQRIKAGVIAVAVGLALATGPIPAAGAASAGPNLKAELLPVTNLPAGWSIDKSGVSDSAASGCGRIRQTLAADHPTATAFGQYEMGSVPYFEDFLFAFKTPGGATAAYRKVTAALSACSGYNVADDGKTYRLTVGQLSFPSVGQRSSAYAIGGSVDGFNLGSDVVIAVKGAQIAALSYVDLGDPIVSDAETFVRKALDRVPS